ncbi:hypothetical protein [Algoriphagus halophilus]|uniref:Uncharacterized protein n=1 Tax=Algoriphagus halophilus TaxID=226505 RepID=A0A1N6H4B5_9BACT|nr:hypothetical protein [Algoriphagus halophilus]SIO14620.1 hypothetical protein SAMN05444394_3544 [Algoriphagus halophilus]
MKNIAIALFLIGIIFQSRAQSERLENPQVSLMEKSDHQYTAGWIFLGTGTAFIVAARAIPTKYDYYDGSSNQTFLSVLGWTGSIAIITSIPLFLSAGKNARLAAKLSLQNHTLYQPIPLDHPLPNFPSLSLKIPL